VTDNLVGHAGEFCRGRAVTTIAACICRESMVHHPSRKATGHHRRGVTGSAIKISRIRDMAGARLDHQCGRTGHDADTRTVTIGASRADHRVIHGPGLEAARNGRTPVTGAARRIRRVGNVPRGRFEDQRGRTNGCRAIVMTRRAGRRRHQTMVHRPGLETTRHHCTGVTLRTVQTTGREVTGRRHRGRGRELRRRNSGGVTRCTSRTDLGVINRPPGETAERIVMACVALNTGIYRDVIGHQARGLRTVMTGCTCTRPDARPDVVETRRRKQEATWNLRTGVAGDTILTRRRYVPGGRLRDDRHSASINRVVT